MVPVAPRVGDVQIENMWDIDEGKRYAIIDVINRSLNDKNWEYKTDFIAGKYLEDSKNSQVFRVAKVFDEVVGYVVVRKDYEDDKASYLAFVVVHKEYQRGKEIKIGSILLEDAIERVKKLGMTSLVFDCREKVKDFYCKFAEKHNIVYEHELCGAFDNYDKKVCFKYYFS
jgi:ribosomal protein S18 acetylase RimI-like enzyme